ncbi:hypothetical protein KKD37_04130 [Patescibacteria group bacterium]|nr:hypothetical protein [Patescibacteria group bacterium]
MENPKHWRLNKQRYRLVGSICPICEEKSFPPRDICPRCSGKIEDNRPNVQVESNTAVGSTIPREVQIDA